jgi:hypothetical protein
MRAPPMSVTRCKGQAERMLEKQAEWRMPSRLRDRAEKGDTDADWRVANGRMTMRCGNARYSA